jgi:uncharacterized protein DUF4388
VTTLRGSTSDFPLESVVGLLAGTSKTGELQVRGDGKVGALGFASGRLIAAVMDAEGGENALGAIFAIHEADFEFTPWSSAPEANLESGDLVALLKRAADARDRLGAIRAQIPDDRMRFKLSETAADSGAVTFTPDRWRALLAVNGERDVSAIADQLRLGKMDALTLLAGLVKDGVIETVSPGPAREAPPPMAATPTAAPPEPAMRAMPAPPEAREEAPAAEWPPAAETADRAPEAPETAEHASEPPRAEAWPSAAEPGPPAAEAPAPAADWASSPEAPSPSDMRSDLDAQLAERLGGFEPTPTSERPAQPSAVPPAVDDRLASLTGIFAPGPAASSVPPAAPATPSQPAADDPWGRPAQPPRAAESWMTPPPASTEAPSNAWAPTAPVQEAQRPAPTPPAAEWAPPPAPAAAPEEKKKGGLFGMFRREESAPVAQIPSAAPSGSRLGMLASFSNALLVEYNSGGYGKGKVESRMANLLMRVDEQADPIDRPLPIVDDLIDATALEREGVAEEQAAPYLATLVRTIYEDAERAYGKDKAKKGYKAAQQQVFKNDTASLSAPDVAGKLPKV